MAEENNIAPTEIAEVAAPVKKTRAPRQKKEVATKGVPVDVIAGSAVSAKPSTARTKKAKVAVAKPQIVVKATRAKRTPPVVVANELDDLIALEGENQRLRKLLSEKLRGENADLRKKLGQA